MFQRILLQAIVPATLAQKWNKNTECINTKILTGQSVHTVASRYPLHTLEASAVIIYEWEKQFKDVSTMKEYDLYISYVCNKFRERSWQDIATAFGVQQHHAKKKNTVAQASLPRDTLLITSVLLASQLAFHWVKHLMGVEFWPWNSILISAFNMNSLDL